jgi:hypothetical protein
MLYLAKGKVVHKPTKTPTNPKTSHHYKCKTFDLKGGRKTRNELET